MEEGKIFLFFESSVAVENRQSLQMRSQLKYKIENNTNKCFEGLDVGKISSDS